MAFSGCKATEVGFLVPPGPPIAVPFTGVDFDTGPYWNAMTPKVLTVPANGKYRVTPFAQWGNPPGNVNVFVGVYKGAVLLFPGDSRQYPNGFNVPAQSCAGNVYDFLMGDLISMLVAQDAPMPLRCDAALLLEPL